MKEWVVILAIVALVVGAWIWQNQADPGPVLDRYWLSFSDNRPYKLDTMTGDVWAYYALQGGWRRRCSRRF